MTPRSVALLVCISGALLASRLHAESKLEKDLRAQIAGQATQLAAQQTAIADLTAQLASAHRLVATANGAAAASDSAASSSGEALVKLTGQLAVSHAQTEDANRKAAGSTDKASQLQTQLSVANVQTASAKSAVAINTTAERVRRAASSVAIQHCSDASEYAAALSGQVLQFVKAQRAASTFHTETMEKIDHDTLMITRLLVLVFIAILIKFIVVVFLFRRKNVKW